MYLETIHHEVNAFKEKEEEEQEEEEEEGEGEEEEEEEVFEKKKKEKQWKKKEIKRNDDIFVGGEGKRRAPHGSEISKVVVA